MSLQKKCLEDQINNLHQSIVNRLEGFLVEYNFFTFNAIQCCQGRHMFERLLLTAKLEKHYFEMLKINLLILSRTVH